MTTQTNALTRDKSEVRILSGLSLFVLALASSDKCYQRKLLPPVFRRPESALAVVLLVLGLGLMALHLLRSRAGFAICKRDNLRGVLIASGSLDTLRGCDDSRRPAGRVPGGDQRALPRLVGLLSGDGLRGGNGFSVGTAVPAGARPAGSREAHRSRGTIIWASILAVSFIEPIYQARFMIGGSPTWAIVYVGVHVYLINIVQLSVYKRYDFLSAYAFRLTYYALWHVLWGHLRLGLLF